MKKKMHKSRVRLTAYALAVLTVISMAVFGIAETIGVMAAETDAKTVVKETEETEKLYIYTAADLIWLGEQCAYDKWSVGKTIVLMNDISLKGTGFEPIPYFSGTFEGQGYTISDLELDGSYYPAGLFGITAPNSVIKNLQVTGSVIPDGEKQAVGGIIGINGGVVQNVSFSGVVSGETAVGGIAGINQETGVIDDAEAKGSIFGEHCTGGIAGKNLGKILKSSNKSYVNNSSGDRSISLEDISTNVVHSFYSFGTSDVTNSFMDTGGIAGYSSGMLLNCKNEGTIGYSRVGYNAGGITGRSCGFIQGCENNGLVLGRKDVGGIAGQVEPFLDVQVQKSDLARIDTQLKNLQSQVDTAIDNIDDAGNEVSVRLKKIKEEQMNYLLDSVERLMEDTLTDKRDTEDNDTDDNDVEDKDTDDKVFDKDVFEKIELPDLSEKKESNKENIENITASLREINEELSLAGEAVSAGMDQTSTDLRAINDQLNDVYGSIGNMVENIQNFTIEDVVADTSIRDIESMIYGKLMSCTNKGRVEADLNAGGIAGIMAVEYEIDPEDDASAEISWKERQSYELKAVITHCVNKGEVTAKKDNAGGICAVAKLGYITHCSAYETIKSEGGDCVGGIAGTAYITIDNCIAKCSLSGKGYVGGILGCGLTQEDGGSVVSGCYSLVEITACEQFEGAVAGCYEGSFMDNYFVSDSLQGINRVSYASAAQPISYEELLELENIPKELESFTLRFAADGEIVKELEFHYGDSFDESVFPDIPKKDSYDGTWSRTELKNLCFDTVVEAEYAPYVTVIASEAQRENERPVFLAEGDFGTDAAMCAEKADITQEMTEEFAAKGKVAEYWKLAFSDDGQKRHDVRFLPAENLENAKLYVKENDTWNRAETEDFGSYKVIRITGNETELAVVSIKQDMLLLFVCGAVVVILLILIVLLEKKTRFWKKLLKKIGIRKLVIVLVICGLAAGIGAGCYVLTLPQVRMSIELAQISREILSLEDQSMKLSLETNIGDVHIALKPDVYVLDRDGISVIVLEENGHRIYMTSEAVFLENGRGYSLGTAISTDLLKQVQKLYKVAEVTRLEEEAGQRYSITTSGEGAKAVMALLVPSTQEQLADIGETTVHITTKDGSLNAVEIQGTAALNDAMETQIGVSARISDIAEADAQACEIPAEVWTKICSTDTASLTHMDTELYHLLLAWIDFSGKQQDGSVALQVSCGPINLKTEHDWRSIVNKTADIANKAELAAIPDLIYEICLNGAFSYERMGDVYKFQLELGEEDMKTLAETLAPDIQTQAVNLTDGIVKVQIKDDSIESFEIAINGTVKVLVSEVEASIGAVFTFD